VNTRQPVHRPDPESLETIIEETLFESQSQQHEPAQVETAPQVRERRSGGLLAQLQESFADETEQDEVMEDEMQSGGVADHMGGKRDMTVHADDLMRGTAGETPSQSDRDRQMGEEQTGEQVDGDPGKAQSAR
jgi:hypothetical protein